ncbi:unnamed protein product, partial [Mesorhabditis belari]|uniref:EF-hand domain-containing protein n=1 Tax=Mesorhabditis belari TaxID=2138241 RepID=A0AAF3FCK0_9BILA
MGVVENTAPTIGDNNPNLDTLSTKSSNIDSKNEAPESKKNEHGVMVGASAEENSGCIAPEKERRLREMYDKFDADRDGSLDLRDLTSALQQCVPHIPSVYAPRLLEKMAPYDRVSFPDFVRYVTRQEEKLEEIFHELDRNKDGRVDSYDLQLYSDKLGIPLSVQHSAHIVRQMGATNLLDSVDLAAFQNFMLLYPSHDPREVFQFWKHRLVIDTGEDALVPTDFTLEELKAGVWWRHLIAGGIAGAVSRTCTAPFDRIKIYLQVNSTRNNRLTLFNTVKLMYREGKIRSFWRGNGINVTKIAPESAIKFTVYEQVKAWLQRRKGKSSTEGLSIAERIMAGSLAGAVSQSIIYPMEVLKTRLALRRSGQLDKGLIRFAYKLYSTEGGFKCFYRGYLPNLLGIMPYAGIDLAMYETLRNRYLRDNPEMSEPSVMALLICGTVSSTCGQLASYPLALVRTRLQAIKWSTNPDQPATMSGQFRYILQNEGFPGLYRGIAPNFLKVIPAVCISYICYERMRKELGATTT